MALGMVSLLKRCLWLGLAHHFIVVSACHGSYGQLIEEFCFSKFKSDMETLRKTLWCNWDKTLGLVLGSLPCLIRQTGNMQGICVTECESVTRSLPIAPS
ncbi:receptor activity-modifying protein 1 isoform X2 [Candoia aspera]|uniref:receptor activity-modifying protein 1 isoform X2 n=1 Tax=Candoia aspera TaxID=51853 RepID=UPI002FD82EF8